MRLADTQRCTYLRYSLSDVSNNTADPDFTTVCAAGVLHDPVSSQDRIGSIIVTKAL